MTYLTAYGGDYKALIVKIYKYKYVCGIEYKG
jgi:hypothetical protein